MAESNAERSGGDAETGTSAGSRGVAARWVEASACAVALLLALFVFYGPLLRDGSLPYGSDVAFASQSARSFTTALGEGVTYPRWVGDANRGFGAPTFVFYPPLAYYAVAGASLFADDLAGALRAGLLVFALLSGVAFFLALRGACGALAAALGALFYVAAPYHTIDLFWRFALAEFAAFAWIPLVFLFTRRLLAGPDPGAWVGLCLGYAALVVTHLVTAYLALFVLGPYALALLLRSRRWTRLVPVAGAGAAALLVSAAYLVPAFVERDRVHLEWVGEAEFADYRRNFVYRDEVAHGYSPAGIKPWVGAAASSQALAAGCAVAALALAVRRRPRRPGGAGRRALPHEAWVFAGLAAWTLFLQTAASTPFWGLIPELATVQFPWRFGVFQAFISSVLVAYAGAALIPLLAVRRSLAVGATALLAAGALPALAVSLRAPEGRRLGFDGRAAEEPEYRLRAVLEYIPRGVAGWRSFHSLGYEQTPRARLKLGGRVEERHWTTHSRSFRVATPWPNTLRIRTFAYPGWQATIDGASAELGVDAKNGTLELALPAGTHDVELRFGSTPLRRAALAASGVGLLLVLGVGGAARRRRRGKALAAGLAFLVVAGCGGDAATPEPARDLLFISLDTTRRDHLPTYGYARDTARNIDALAREGAVFENAVSQATNTNPSHASMFTSLYPHVHGSRFNGQRLGDAHATLAQVLADAGFRTAAFVSGATLRGEITALDRGFELYDDAFPGPRRAGADTVAAALRWLRAREANERVFCFVHLFDAHGPYLPPAAYERIFPDADPGPVVERIPRYQRIEGPAGEPLRYLGQFVDRYDALIRYMDDLLPSLLAEVDLERTVVVVIADHGETLGERYHPLDHGAQVFDEQIRIPLVLRAPGFAPRRIEAQVETVDLLPTLLELLGVAPPAGHALQGRSLVPLLRGEAGGREFVFSTARVVPQRYADRNYRLVPGLVLAVRGNRWKLAFYPGAEGNILELYDLTADPLERENLAAAHPAVRDRYLQVLSHWIELRDARRSAEAELSDDLRDQLEALGYLGD